MGVVQSRVGGFGLIPTTSGGTTMSASAKRGATGDGPHVGGSRNLNENGQRSEGHTGPRKLRTG
jgi:hypothetical protein